MLPRVVVVLLFAAGVMTPRGAAAQVVNPADKQKPAPTNDAPQTGERRRTFEVPPVVVYGEAPLDEEDRIGSYAQPRWTAHRRFGETRVYVVPEGTVEFEYWFRPTTKKDGGGTEFQTQYEAEFGLPGRFQLDLYAVAHKEGPEGSFGIDEQKVEVRWALADWDKIWGNPTLYFEWAQVNGGADVGEVKLLLGGELRSRWHWGSNLVWEHQMGGAYETSNEWTTGLSYTVRDTKFSAGVETQLAFVNERLDTGGRSDFAKEFLVGPSFQFRPLPQIHLDVAPLFGVTKDAPRSKVFIVFGWEF